jgi:regulator of sirC expression with transglutaminase-like and TPR domain
MEPQFSRRCILEMGGAALAARSLPINSQASAPISRCVARILEASERNSFLQAKVAFDALIGSTLRLPDPRLEKLADGVRQMAGPSPTDRYKLAAIRRAIYESGPWNDNRAFRYDQADPLGMNVENKLLSTYLRTRLGNCVSMPILFLILADRAGLNVGLSTAPLHVFVRYIDPAGEPFNVEATSGGHFARDEWYRQNTQMSDRAIASGLYMRSLSRVESVALMATTVVESLMDAGRNREAAEVCDVILQHSPRDGFIMVKKGTAIARMMQAEFIDSYPSPDAIPEPLRQRYRMLAAQNRSSFEAAEALGWEPAE